MVTPIHEELFRNLRGLLPTANECAIIEDDTSVHINAKKFLEHHSPESLDLFIRSVYEGFVTAYRGKFYTLEPKFTSDLNPETQERNLFVSATLMKDSRGDVHTIFQGDKPIWTKEL